MNNRTVLTRYCPTTATLSGFDFLGKNKEMLGEISVPIRSYLDTNGKFLIVIMNHSRRQYFIGVSASLRPYLFNTARFITTGNSTAISRHLVAAYSSSEKDMWSVEVVRASPTNEHHIHRLLEGWRSVKSARADRSASISIIRAIHQKTGWTRFYSVATERENDQPAGIWSIFQNSLVYPMARTARLMRDHAILVHSYDTYRKSIVSSICDSIRLKSGFVFSVHSRHTDVIGAQGMNTIVRDCNADAIAAWLAPSNFKRLYEKLMNVDELPPVPPKALVVAQAAGFTETPKPVVRPPFAPTVVSNPAAIVPKITGDVTHHPLPNPGVAEVIYKARRDKHHNSTAMLIALRLSEEGISINNFAEVAVEMVNRSEVFVLSLGGHIEQIHVKNAIVNSTAPYPECDFVLLEILASISEAVVTHVNSNAA